MEELTARLNQAGTVLLVGQNTWQDDTKALLLTDPAAVLCARVADEVPGVLRRVDEELRGGRIVAGSIGFEAGRAFGLCNHDPWPLTPLVWMASYPAGNAVRLSMGDLAAATDPLPPPDVGIELNVSRQDYCDAIATIKDYIAAGDTYQVNYTCHARFAWDVDPARYFLSMVGSHPVPYAAWLNLGEAQVLSLSPELFLSKRGRTILTKPMKGTRPRGRTPAEDAELSRELTTSEKDRAENLMIVDMMRNDLGRFCETGSVHTPVLFEAEKYGSVWQMTSTVIGQAPEGAGVADIMAATFPGASVTGAPKKHTLEIIRELEPEPRGVYCGAIGLFMPDGDMTCNLPIRTLVHTGGRYDLGIGAGIVWDSDEQSEYDETLLKSQFAFRLGEGLRIFETLLLAGDGQYTFLDEHVRRMAQSAEYWEFAFDEVILRNHLDEVATEAPAVVRVELTREGDLSSTVRPVPPAPQQPVQVALAEERVDSSDRFLYHKTTRRKLYDTMREGLAEKGFFEAIFANEQGRVTEGTITNLFLRVGDQWLTPPVMEGLLPGIWREAFISQTDATEQPVSIEALREADEVVIGNSVRGAVRVDRILAGDRVLFQSKDRA